MSELPRIGDFKTVADYHKALRTLDSDQRAGLPRFDEPRAGKKRDSQAGIEQRQSRPLFD